MTITQTEEDIMAKMLVQETAGLREFELVDYEIQIGRELDNALRLADPSISRHHAVLRRTATGYELKDLHSSNGVLVNGIRLQAAMLRDGDRVTLGQIQMTFVDPVPDEALATMALPTGEPTSPLGTVRIDAAEMAKIQGLGPRSMPEPMPPPIPAAPMPAAESPASATVPPTPTTASASPRTPPETQFSVPPQSPPVTPPTTSSTLAVSANSPAPAFLQTWLPTIPDNARPTGERGDFLTRLLAHLIDMSPLILLSIVGTILQVVAMGGLLKQNYGFAAASGALGCLLALIQLALGLGYLFFFPWCWIKFGATPGKKIMKLRVVPCDDLTGRLDLGGAVLRLVGYLVNGVIGFIVAMILMLPIGILLGLSGSQVLFKLISPIIYLAALGCPYLLILGAKRKGLHDILSKSLVIKVDR